ncbi:recombinase family protein [Nocardia sp. R6R-6]|uniref:recombinase family protein n=1 Tax=Nocardia sp. R6R-6 TaxID=3459303 RepID=UPI00403D6294
MTSKTASTSTNAILRIAIYVRISQDRSGDGKGVDRQEGDCRALAERLGATAVRVYSDNDISAYSGKKRPGYLSLCEDIERGAVDVVIAWHPDRLHRSPIELEHFITLIEGRKTGVHTVQAGLWDLSSPSGRMVARQLGAVARYESEHKGERIKAARVQQALAGEFHGGMRPYGFERDGVTVREAEAVEIVRMYEQTVAGVSLRQIVADLNRRGIPTATGRGQWTSVAVRDIIKRPRNAGWSVHKGEIVGKAVWPALVSEETWKAAVAIVTNPARRTTPGNTPRWLGSGVYLCDVCGKAQLRCSTASGKPRRVYRCAARDKQGVEHVHRDALHLDAFVEETVVARLERPDTLNQLITRNDGGGEALSLRVEQTALRQRLDSLADLFAAGDIDARQLASASAQLKAKLTEIDTALISLGMRSPLEELAGRDVRTAWFGTKEDRSDGLSLGHRRAIVDALMTVRVLVAPHGRRADGRYFDPNYVKIDWKQ